MKIAEGIGSELLTPFGTLAVISRQETEPVLMGASFSPLNSLVKRVVRAQPEFTLTVAQQPQVILDALALWIDTGRDHFEKLTMWQPGGDFMQACWSALRLVPPGDVVTYSQLATMAGRPKAVRAAGTACATNLIAPFIPCHRVIKSDNTLGNYGYGAALKERLLRHEGLVIQ